MNTSVAEANVLGHFVVQQDTETSSLIAPPTESAVAAADERKEIELEKKREEERRRKEREDKINRVINYLARQGSPVAYYEIAAKIVDHSEANGADFRVVMAIMGVESGFCRASFWHNCFGYLNGVHYSSWEDAFDDLVPKVSRQYAARYGWNFAGLAQAYGQHEWERTSANMYYFASQI